MRPSCSIVMCEMQRRASTTNGSRMAWVGQASMQARQVPHRSVMGLSGSNSTLVTMQDKKKNEPCCGCITRLCLPRHPNPARTAHVLSSTGP